jgi:ankyrin repeat protein
VIDMNSETALLDAVKSGHTSLVSEALARNKTQLSVASSNGMTVVHIASQAGNAAIVKLLAEAGANLSVQDKMGYTPMHYAAVVGHVHVVRLLLDLQASTLLSTTKGETVPCMLSLHV